MRESHQRNFARCSLNSFLSTENLPQSLKNLWTVNKAFFYSDRKEEKSFEFLTPSFFRIVNYRRANSTSPSKFFLSKLATLLLTPPTLFYSIMWKIPHQKWQKGEKRFLFLRLPWANDCWARSLDVAICETRKFVLQKLLTRFFKKCK